MADYHVYVMEIIKQIKDFDEWYVEVEKKEFKREWYSTVRKRAGD